MEVKVTESVVIFDGECNLCNGVVGWLLHFAAPQRFNFIPFQSTAGQEQLRKYGFPTTALETVILIEDSGVYTHSDGFLKIVSKIPGWKVPTALLAFIPRGLRDPFYRLASRNRLRWFGKSRSCTVSFRPN